jgi:hypothetical protein
MARILFFTSEPGGAEVLTPLIPVTRDAGHEVRIAAYGHGAARFQANGICYRTVEPLLPEGRSFLDEERPDFLITSATSLPERDMSERYLWRHARRMGIGTLAFIDQWQNYSARFSGCSKDERLKYLPDYVNCIDDIGKAETLEAGLPKEKLLTFGHPYLAGVRKAYSYKTVAEILPLLDTAASEYRSEDTFLFVSEPLLENFENSRGYNQYIVLDYFLKNVQRSRRNARVIIKLHPKDRGERFREIASQFSDIRTHFVQNELSSLECLVLADRVFGMTSIMLIEAYLLGKSVVSLQPGLVGEDPLVLSRHRLICRNSDLADFDPFSIASKRKGAFNVTFNEAGFLEFLAGKVGRNPLTERQISS